MGTVGGHCFFLRKLWAATGFDEEESARASESTAATVGAAMMRRRRLLRGVWRASIAHVIVAVRSSWLWGGAMRRAAAGQAALREQRAREREYDRTAATETRAVVM